MSDDNQRVEEIAERRKVQYEREGDNERAQMLVDIDDLLAEVERLTRERDLAVAHDSQSYPTAEAYEKVCAALNSTRALLAEKDAEKSEALTAQRRQLSELHDQTLVELDRVRVVAKGEIRRLTERNDELRKQVTTLTARLAELEGKGNDDN